MMVSPGISAICRRDLRRWFSNPNGYVFMVLFVLLAAAAQFLPDAFFARNLASLDTLNEFFPLLLLFFIPAVTMGLWAGERQNGTDELLLTLPISDLSVVLGKFFSAAGIYTAALGFSLPLVVAIAFLGNPDPGLIISNYLAFWMLGVLLIGAGMLGSQLSDNLTVAFIIGALFCALVVFAEWMLVRLLPGAGRGLAGLGPIARFGEIGQGVIAVSSIALFAGWTVVLLYLNVLLLGRRHWHKHDTTPAHRSVRLACIAIAVMALVSLLGRFGGQVDATSERIHTLSPYSRAMISAMPADQRVVIQAWVSPEVPADFVQTRRALLDTLRQFSAIGGVRVDIRIFEVDRFSDEARRAGDTFGITPRSLMAEESGRSRSFDVLMGVAMTSGVNQQVIPFLDRGLSVEYELLRTLRAVTQAERRTVGIVMSDLNMFGDTDFRTGSSTPPWDIVSELELQYNVVRVSLEDEVLPEVDVLLVPMASSLPQPQMDALLEHILRGGPTIIVDDPFPTVAPELVPSTPRGGQPNPFMPSPPREPKGNYRTFLAQLGIVFPSDRIVWDSYKPHLQFEFDPEIVFISPGSDSSQAFNPDFPATAGLQEVVAIFPGSVRPSFAPGLEFAPLLMTGAVSGSTHERSVFQQDFFSGLRLNRERILSVDPYEHVLAAHISGRPEAFAEAGEVNLIFIADLDMISPAFFQIRRQGLADFNFDNVAFILNSIDVLAGETDFVELRKRRPRHRTLTRIERLDQEFTDSWLQARQRAEEQANQSLQQARERLQQRIDEIRQSEELSREAIEARIRQIEDIEEAQFERRERLITEQRNREIDEARADRVRRQNAILAQVRALAIGLSPIPAILVGVLVWISRLSRESNIITDARRVGGKR